MEIWTSVAAEILNVSDSTIAVSTASKPGSRS